MWDIYLYYLKIFHQVQVLGLFLVVEGVKCCHLSVTYKGIPYYFP